MAGMATEAREALLAKASELSDYFREIGPAADRANTFAHESVRAYRDSGLGAAIVPEQFGGGGADILTCSQIMTELARGDASIALAYNMHYITVGLALGLLDETQRKHWLSRVVDGAIMFGPISEKRAGFSGLADTIAIPQPEGGWKLYGQKNWGTLCEAADIILTTATVTDAEGNVPEDFEGRVNAEFSFVADFDLDEDGQGDGIRIEKSWDALGMHATGTQIVHLEGFYIPEDGRGGEWRAGAFNVLEWASILFASVYYGLSLRILEETRVVLAKKNLGATFGAVVSADTKVANIGHIIDGIGEMAVRCDVSRRVLWQTCNDLMSGYDDEWPAEMRFPYIGIAKTTVAENVVHMSRRAMSLVGGSAFRNGTVFERFYRDAAASMFQPLNADQTSSYLGECLLAPDEVAD